MFGEEVDLEGQHEDPLEFQLAGHLEQAADERVSDAGTFEPWMYGDGAHLSEIRPQHMQSSTADDLPIEIGHPEFLDGLVQRHKVFLQQNAPGIDIDKCLDGGDVGGTGTAHGHRGGGMPRIVRDAGCTFSAHA
ncbi:Uncharacterised protein [Mycobacteroides abscessus subsp. abscessus]|nr:Uncharacterised protein [Mycobacteroides abscessus subsp. abscessus]